jgi:C-terminal processing protease CtpA/Prc
LPIEARGGSFEGMLMVRQQAAVLLVLGGIFFASLGAAQNLRDEPGAIGAVVAQEENGLRLKEVMPAGPADQAGLMPGDLIVKIGDVVVADLGADEAIQILRGRAFTKVKLTIFRGVAGEPEVIEILRAPLNQFVQGR